jgi:hypothetical protein
MMQVANSTRIRSDPNAESPKKPREVLHPLEESDENIMKNNSKVVFSVYGLLIVLGIATGYVLATKTHLAGSVGGQKATTINTSTVVGSTDAKTFKDSAQGTLEKGGSDGGEGSHNLVRDGGPSQTVYLISSIVDLDKFAGKKVKVWGQTMTAKTVPWLMDVGKVELITE